MNYRKRRARREHNTTKNTTFVVTDHVNTVGKLTIGAFVPSGKTVQGKDISLDYFHHWQDDVKDAALFLAMQKKKVSKRFTSQAAIFCYAVKLGFKKHKYEQVAHATFSIIS